MSAETPDPRRRERKSTPIETLVLVGFWDDFRRPLFDVGGGPISLRGFGLRRIVAREGVLARKKGQSYITTYFVFAEEEMPLCLYRFEGVRSSGSNVGRAR